MDESPPSITKGYRIMRKNLKSCKKLARETLAGNYTVPVIGSIAVAAMSVISSYISTALFPGDSLYAIIGGEVFSFILSLVICVFSAGLYRIYLNISRREAYSFGDLLYFFSHQPDHVIVASFVLALINLVTSLPLAWFSFTSNMGNTTEEQMNWAVTYMLLTLLGFALNLLAAMPFTMSYYILSDNSDIKGVQALKASAKLMKGHYWEYMKMLLSFVPWIIFSIFTLYLALIWLVPYIETCMAVFYRNISGEFDEPPVDTYPPVTPIPQFHDETEA